MVLNDGASIYFGDATLASAFVARGCVGYKIATAECVRTLGGAVPTHRLRISTNLDRLVRDIAERRRVPTDELMISFIDKGGRRARSGWFRRSLLFVLGPTLTALLVLWLLWILPSPPTILPPLVSVHLMFLSALHWIRVFAQSLFPWPATLIVIAAIFFGSASAFGNLLDLFGLFRKVRILARCRRS